MRVLFWSGNFWPLIGGAEVLASKLLPALRERGYEFIVVTSQRPLDCPSVANYKGIPVYRFPFRENFTDLSRLMEMRQYVAKLKRTFAPDLVHISAVEMDHFFHLLTGDAYPAPLLVTLHNVLPDHAVRQDSWLGQLIRNADWLTCVSAAVLTETRQLVPEIIPRSSVLHNGLDTPTNDPEPPPIDAPRLLCLGRLKTRKGFDVALTAFASITDRFPDARLTIAGDGPERSKLEQQAVKLGLKGVIEFIGWVAPEKVPAVVNASTIVVMPSRHEPFGLVALDAALMARPIVASRVGGLSEVVIHQQTGLLVEPEDSAELAEAIIFLLDHPEKAMRMGQAARQRALDVFSWERCVDGYANLYKRLIDGTQSITDKSTQLS